MSLDLINHKLTTSNTDSKGVTTWSNPTVNVSIDSNGKVFKKGKIYKFTNLHQRIEHFTKSQKRLGQLLLAIKIIGNEGSHIGDIKIDDILDAYEILEEVVEIVYIKKRNKITTIAKEIVEKNKPRTK